MSNILRSRARRGARISTKEKAEQLEQALAAADIALGETQDGIDQALQDLYDAIDRLEALLPSEEDPPEDRERVLREKLDLLCATAVAEAATGVPPDGGSVAERLDEVMEAFEALPATKWPEGPIGEELPEWMLEAIREGLMYAAEGTSDEAVIEKIRDGLVSQKRDPGAAEKALENPAAETAEKPV
jgi:hypothetical protein